MIFIRRKRYTYKLQQHPVTKQYRYKVLLIDGTVHATGEPDADPHKAYFYARVAIREANRKYGPRVMGGTPNV